ncbi:saccharopine dehydrogenase [Aspergillus tubingensis]|nr:saccharopine dehydrogenase [Aspergillus tubingensis]
MVPQPSNHSNTSSEEQEPTNGANLPAKLSSATEPAEENKPTPDTKTVDDAKPTDETEPRSQVPTSVDTAPKESVTESNVGEKREHEVTPATVEAGKTGADDATEPATKKKKRNDAETNGPETAPPIPTTAKHTKKGQTTNGDKKKSGRSKTAKEFVKREPPTDGISSRTRSRTKVAP